MVNVFDKDIEALVLKARSSSRKRAHLNLHASYAEPVQKVMIALASGTYIPPHYHRHSYQTEVFTVLSGIVRLVVFDETGMVTDVHFLGENCSSSIVQVPAGVIHTVVCHSDTALLFECKQGPFDPQDCKIFPDWVCGEGDERVPSVVQQLAKISVGERLI